MITKSLHIYAIMDLANVLLETSKPNVSVMINLLDDSTMLHPLNYYSKSNKV